MSPSPGGREERQAAYRRGRAAESLAAWLLRFRGFRILARDYRCAVGEIDIIARRANLLIAVEVKARTSAAEAAEAITPRQQMRITRAMSDFIAHHPNYADFDVRFDAILAAPWWRPRHLPDAWRPD